MDLARAQQNAQIGSQGAKEQTQISGVRYIGGRSDCHRNELSDRTEELCVATESRTACIDYAHPR